MFKEPSPDSGSSSWDGYDEPAGADAAEPAGADAAEPAGAPPTQPAGADPAEPAEGPPAEPAEVPEVPGFDMALVPAGSPVSMPQFIASIHALLRGGITQCLLS